MSENVNAVPSMKDKTLTELWSHLNRNEKTYLLVFPAFDTKRAAVEWLRDNKLVSDYAIHRTMGIIVWVIRRRMQNPYFKQFEHLRPSIAHDDVIALYKKEQELLLWAKVSAEVKQDKIKDRDSMSTLRKFGGKISSVNPEEAEAEDNVDWDKILKDARQ